MATYKNPNDDVVPEPVTREGERAIWSKNNSLIIFGRDRAKNGPATREDGYGNGPGAGAIHIVVGRHEKSGDPNFLNDDAFIYMSMKTDPDANLGVTEYVAGASESPAEGKPAIVVKSDNIRIVCRDAGDTRILSENGDSWIVFSQDHINAKVKRIFWMDVGGTEIEFRDSTQQNRIKIGPLAEALADLANVINDAFNAVFVSSFGNMAAPVPLTSNVTDLKYKMQEAMRSWKNRWIDGEFVKR